MEDAADMDVDVDVDVEPDAEPVLDELPLVELAEETSSSTPPVPGSLVGFSLLLTSLAAAANASSVLFPVELFAPISTASTNRNDNVMPGLLTQD